MVYCELPYENVASKLRPELGIAGYADRQVGIKHVSEVEEEADALDSIYLEVDLLIIGTGGVVQESRDRLRRQSTCMGLTTM